MNGRLIRHILAGFALSAGVALVLALAGAGRGWSIAAFWIGGAIGVVVVSALARRSRNAGSAKTRADRKESA